MQHSIFVGLDVGSSHCHQTVINSDGALVRSRSVPTGEQHLRNAFADLQGDVQVHAEASELSDWVRSIIKPMVTRFVISHPRSLAWIAKDSVKDDAVDARQLAELLRLNRVHEVYYEECASRRSFKHLVVHHQQLSREQARLKSKIKARLRTLGIIRQDARLFSLTGQDELFASITDALIKQTFHQSFAVLNQMLTSLAEAKCLMLEFSRRLPEVRLLQSAPGVGQITACRFVAYIQAPQRFSNKRKLWRYACLGITRGESNGKRLAYPHQRRGRLRFAQRLLA
jgi:hypothetical protein